MLLGKPRDGPADPSIREPGRDKWNSDDDLKSYHEVLLDPQHKEARRRLEEAGFSEDAIGDYEWEQVNGRPGTETEYDSTDDADVAALLKRRAQRKRRQAHMEMVHRVMNGNPPIDTQEVIRRRENKRLKRAGVAGYESATTSDGELSAERARGAAEKILGLPRGFFPDVDPNEERLLLQVANRLNREHTSQLYEEAVRRVAEGRANPVVAAEVDDAARRRAARAALNLTRTANVPRRGEHAGHEDSVGPDVFHAENEVAASPLSAGALQRIAPAEQLELVARSSIGPLAPAPSHGDQEDAAEGKPHLLPGAEVAVEARRQALEMRGRLDHSYASEASRVQHHPDRFGVRDDGQSAEHRRAPDMVDAMGKRGASDGELSEEERQAAVAREVLQEDRIPFAHATSGWEMPSLSVPAGASDSEMGSELEDL